MQPRIQGTVDGIIYDEWFDDMETAWSRFNTLAALKADTECVTLELCGHKIGASCILIQVADWRT